MTGGSVVARLEKLASESLTRNGYSGGGTTLIVGASGGPDSSALLHCVHRISPQHRLKIHVAHLNHDFRGEEADEDARFVAALAQELGLPATVEKQDPIAYQRERRISSFEQAAREMRYSFLLNVARRQQAAAVAMGHTADDLAETILEHILRGSGLTGLRGMSEISRWPWPRDVDDVVLFRPLLAVTKEETVSYCRALNRDFRVDSGNILPQFTRNRVRNQLLPLLAADYNPQVKQALVRLSHTAALELDYLEEECRRRWPEVVSNLEDDSPGLRFDREALSALHPALQRRLLRQGYIHLAGDARRLRESHLTAMAGLLEPKKPGTGGQPSLGTDSASCL